MKIGDLVQYQNMSWLASKCVGMIIEVKQDKDWREPAYMVDWSTWPGEPAWYHPHNLKLIATIEDNNEKTALV
jgi:hypothetical protein